MGASVPDQALVARDQAPAGLDPTGFDPSRFEYRFSISKGRERHDWIVAGSLGAVNVWAEPRSAGSSFSDERWFGGIECHSARELNSSGGYHERCWLLGAPCWHDGSSLQFSEQVEYRLPDPSSVPIGGAMLEELKPLLRSRYRTWLAEPASAIEARSDATGTGAAEGESATRQGDAQ